jgi:diadenosine tetraphosphate (Ap4A) HIT family hydrolase
VARLSAVPAATAIHAEVAACRAGTAERRVARLASGWAVLAERQVLAGYCLLLPDPVVPHLNALSPPERARFLLDMGCLGDALLAVTGALRINYAMFGNVEPALHAHLFPRQALEPDSTRTAQPWALDWVAAPRYSAQTHGELQARLAEWLAVHADGAD